MDTIYTLDEAAEKLGFSRKTLQREINAGRYPNSFKVGKRSCTTSADVERYQQQCKTELDDAARKKAAEAAGRLRCAREIEACRRMLSLAPATFHHPAIRTFSPNDPNRLP